MLSVVARYHESRRCSRDTYPESHITKYTGIRRLIPQSRSRLMNSQEGFRPYSCIVIGRSLIRPQLNSIEGGNPFGRRVQAGGDGFRALWGMGSTTTTGEGGVVVERDFFIDNLLVRIHLSIDMILVDRPCAMGV